MAKNHGKIMNDSWRGRSWDRMEVIYQWDTIGSMIGTTNRMEYNDYAIGLLNDEPTHSLIGSSMVQGHSQTLKHIGPLV